MQQNPSARTNYLQAEVHTATPQKLQLLLVEAAIKNIHRTKQAWNESKFDVGFETLSRAQDIVAEILCSLDVESNPEIAKKLASIYLFVFRRLAEGGMSHEAEKLDDALRVLNSERETWRLVCEKFGSMLPPPEGTPASQTDHGDSVEFTGAQVLVSQPTGTPSTFSRPVGAPFASGVRPLGAIQTDPVLANPSTPVASPDASGNNWEV